MSAVIIDGKTLSAKIREELTAEICAFTAQTKKSIGLAVIRVGNDPASEVYVRNKVRACAAVGIRSKEIVLPEETAESALISLVRELAADETVNGILVQLPLPDGIDAQKVLSCIPKEKDVDGFHPENVGNLLLGNPAICSCTPEGVMEMLKSTGVSLSGKNAVVVGRSNIVGKPMAVLLLATNATVTVCHSKTADLPHVVKNADIVVAAIGKPKFITKEMIKPGAIVIDVGINRTPDGLCGDVDFDEVKEVASFISPVPGGVGPMTVTMLLKNTLVAAKTQNGLL